MKIIDTKLNPKDRFKCPFGVVADTKNIGTDITFSARRKGARYSSLAFDKVEYGICEGFIEVFSSDSKRSVKFEIIKKENGYYSVTHVPTGMKVGNFDLVKSYNNTVKKAKEYLQEKVTETEMFKVPGFMVEERKNHRVNNYLIISAP